MRTIRSTKLLVPGQVSESLCIAPVPNYAEQSSASFIDFFVMKRFNEEVNLSPVLTPVGYRDTIICYKDSTRKKFKSETTYEPKVKPRRFTDTLIVFPKRPQKGYVTFVDYHIDECRRWFKTTMEFKAKTYTTKFIGSDMAADKPAEKDMNDNLPWNNVGSNVDPSNGPGASQIFLPRWNRDGLEQNLNSKYPDLNGEIQMNGY